MVNRTSDPEDLGFDPHLDYRKNGEETSSPKCLANSISQTLFSGWYRKRKFTRNIRQGKPYFNGPNNIKPPGKYSPSGLLQCPRKKTYDQLNSPGETQGPKGIFWVGSRFEEDLILPYLEDVVVGPNEFVTNSLWIDVTVESQVGDLQLRGETDPVIVDPDSRPILVTEIKTKRSLDGLDSPNDRHLAQIHAYMVGLSEKYDQTIPKGVIIYADRTTFSIKSFQVYFDENFWKKEVLEWAETHTTYRLDNELPPSEPMHDWECDYCKYRERCGKGDREYMDSDATGLLPLFEYPRGKISEYLKSFDGAKLTPTLAEIFPELAAEFGVFDWRCYRCGQEFAWDSVEWEGDISSPPFCPSCADNDVIRPLKGPLPEDQPPQDLDYSDSFS